MMRVTSLETPKVPLMWPWRSRHGELGGHHPGFLAIMPDFVFEQIGDGLAGLDDAALIGLGGFPMVLIEKIAVVLADEFRTFGESRPLGHALVGHDESGCEVLEIDMHRDVVDHLTQQEAFLLHLSLGLLAAADVDDGSCDAAGLALAVPDDGSADAQPAPVTAAGEHARIHRQGFRAAVLQRLGHRQFHRAALVRVDRLKRRQEQMRGAVLAAFEKLQDAPRVIDFLAVRPPIPDALVGGLEREFQPLELHGIPIIENPAVIIHGDAKLAQPARHGKQEFPQRCLAGCPAECLPRCSDGPLGKPTAQGSLALVLSFTAPAAAADARRGQSRLPAGPHQRHPRRQRRRSGGNAPALPR
jgi:hypothetical protein